MGGVGWLAVRPGGTDVRRSFSPVKILALTRRNPSGYDHGIRKFSSNPWSVAVVIRSAQPLTAILACAVLILQPMMTSRSACGCQRAEDVTTSSGCCGNSPTSCGDSIEQGNDVSRAGQRSSCCDQGGGHASGRLTPSPGMSDVHGSSGTQCRSAETQSCHCGQTNCPCGELTDSPPTPLPNAATVERRVASDVDRTTCWVGWRPAEPTAARSSARRITPPAAVSSQAILCRWLI